MIFFFRKKTQGKDNGKGTSKSCSTSSVTEDSRGEENLAPLRPCGAEPSANDIDISIVPDVNCVVNLRHFLHELTVVTMHKTNCKNGQTKLKVNTVKNVGLKTELTIECLSCCWKKRIKSEPDSPITMVKEYLIASVQASRAQ